MAGNIRADHHRISPTAILCASARAKYLSMPYTKEIYAELNKAGIDGFQGMIAPYLRKLALKFPNITARASILEGRYLSTNDAINRLGPCNVLELACGISPRGLEFTAPGSARDDSLYVETDLPGILDMKRKMTCSIRAAEGLQVSPNHHFIDLNALHMWQLRRAGELIREKGHDNPVAIIHEGLLMYMNDGERAKLRDNVAEFLKEYSPNGACITTDMSNRDLFNRDPILRWIVRKIEKKTGRKFFGFKSDQEALDFLAQGGLKGEFFPNEHLLDRLSCSETLGVDKERLEQVAPNYRACFITLQS